MRTVFSLQSELTLTREDSQFFENSTRELTPLQKPIKMPKAEGITEMYNSLKSESGGNQLEKMKMELNEKEDEISDLHTLLLEQKEANRKIQEINYRSEDLSVTTEAMYVDSPEELDQEVQELRRSRDRLKHENFSLQNDVDELEEDKERTIQEIEDNEIHIQQLKRKKLV